MDIQVIKNEIIIISSYLDDLLFQDLFSYIKQLDYTRSESEEYVCYKTRFSQNIEVQDKLMKLMDMDTLREMLTKIYNRNLSVNHIGEVIKMVKDDYLWTHVDVHNLIQWVVYFNDFDQWDGWILSIPNYCSFIPKKNTIVLFPWNTQHNVSQLKTTTTRYTLAFWFNDKMYA